MIHDFFAGYPFYAFPVLNLMGECYNFHMTGIKKCAIFLADGFEECEGLITVDMLRRAGITIDTISMNETDEVLTSHKIRLHADRLFRDTDMTGYDVLILPGGKLGTENLEKSEELKQYLVSWNLSMLIHLLSLSTRFFLLFFLFLLNLSKIRWRQARAPGRFPEGEPGHWHLPK